MLLLAVALVLAADHGRGIDDAHRTQNLHLLVAQALGLEGGRWLHGEEREDLEQVRLHHVAERAGALVEAAAALDAYLLGHRELDVVHVATVPQRLQERVREPEHQDVLDGLLAQVVVDAEDLPLLEDLVHVAVELLRALEILTERLLDHDARVPLEALLAQAADDAGVGIRRRSAVEQGAEIRGLLQVRA